MGFLLDTNVLSETQRRRPDGAVRQWLRTVDDAQLHVSVLTIGEIRKGVERLRPRDPRRAISLESWLDAMVQSYGDRVLPVDQDAAELWGRLNAPRPLPNVDSLLAATAITRDLTLVTRNVTDVASTGVRIVNPFASN